METFYWFDTHITTIGRWYGLSRPNKSTCSRCPFLTHFRNRWEVRRQGAFSSSLALLWNICRTAPSRFGVGIYQLMQLKPFLKTLVDKATGWFSLWIWCCDTGSNLSEDQCHCQLIDKYWTGTLNQIRNSCAVKSLIELTIDSHCIQFSLILSSEAMLYVKAYLKAYQFKSIQ